MDILKALENIGQTPKFESTSNSQLRSLLTSLFVPEYLLTPLLANDKETLEEVAGFKKDIVCFILSPAREQEVPKEDHKPPEDEDEPYEQSSLLKFA